MRPFQKGLLGKNDLAYLHCKVSEKEKFLRLATESEIQMRDFSTKRNLPNDTSHGAVTFRRTAFERMTFIRTTIVKIAILQNDIQQNEVKQSEIWQNDFWQKDIQMNDIQQKNI